MSPAELLTAAKAPKGKRRVNAQAERARVAVRSQKPRTVAKSKRHDDADDFRVVPEEWLDLPPLRKDGTRFLNRKELIGYVGVTFPAIWQWMREGRFPVPRKLTNGQNARVMWLEGDVAQWMLSRPV